jgi:hypothetical protein
MQNLIVALQTRQFSRYVGGVFSAGGSQSDVETSWVVAGEWGLVVESGSQCSE